MKRADERGAGTLLTAVIGLGMATTTVFGVCVLGWMGTQKRVAATADQAALGGAYAHARGEDACRQAREVAVRNRSRLIGCTIVGEGAGFVLRVDVEAPLRPVIAVRGFPQTTRFSSWAGPGDPEAP